MFGPRAASLTDDGRLWRARVAVRRQGAADVHVRSGNGFASFWLLPVRVRDYQGYTPREVDRIRRIIGANRAQLLRRWHDFFDHAT